MRKPIVNLSKRFSRICPDHGGTMISEELEKLQFQGVTIKNIKIHHCTDCDFRMINIWELMEKYNALKNP